VAPFHADKVASDSAGALAPAVGAFCGARLRRPVDLGQPAPGTDPSVARERRYWTAFAALEAGNVAQAASEAAAGLAALGNVPNDELRWRLAAIGKLAADAGKDSARAGHFDATSRAALDRVRSGWKTDIETYLRRPDLEYLRKRAGLQTP
jgi:hypothetical protein